VLLSRFDRQIVSHGQQAPVADVVEAGREDVPQKRRISSSELSAFAAPVMGSEVR